MDEKATGVLTAGSPAMADPALEGVTHAAPYADLLRPIPDAGAMLHASDRAVAGDLAAVEMVRATLIAAAVGATTR